MDDDTKARIELGPGLGFDLDIEVKASGHKSSEGDGRTAADIKAEQERQDSEERRTNGTRK